MDAESLTKGPAPRGTTAPPPTDLIASRRDTALAYCSKQIDWYWNVSRKNRRFYNWLQPITLIISGITPVIILVPNLPGGDVAKAIPAALVAILAGVTAHFNWRDNWLRFSSTAGVLESELALFEAKSGSYAAHLTEGQALDAIDLFMTRVARLVTDESTSWRTIMNRKETEVSSTMGAMDKPVT